MNKVLILFLIIIFIQDSNAVCNFSFQTLSDVNFSSTTNVQKITKTVIITRPQTGNSCRDFHVTFSFGGSFVTQRAMSNGSSSLSYNLYQNNNLSRILYDYPILTSKNNALSGRFKKNSKSISLKYYAQLPQVSNSQDGGYYSDTIIAKIYDGQINQGGNLITSSNFVVNFTMPKTLRISLVNSGSAFNASDTYQLLSFGQITNGASQGFDLKVETNTAFSIAFSSQNNGKLKHIGHNEFINYLFKINNGLHSLQNSSNIPVVLINSIGSGPIREEIFPITVEINDTIEKIAGEYQDFITVEATSLE